MKKYILIIFLFQFLNLKGDTTIVALDRVHHFFGNSGNNRVFTDTISFPNHTTQFSEIIMNINLECPNGGCDPWDRKAQISVNNRDDWFEIGRYVTPYGVECGWSLNVSDYRSFLIGDVILRSYIDTWVDPGWLVSISFDFIVGNPDYAYTSIRKVWNYSNLVYGDNTNPIDIPSYNGYIPSNALASNLRMITTGHGQGNTDNAAEFSYKIHDININDEPTFIHNIWRSDCESNNCSPQNGTWIYDRAGFCPGDKVTPQDFNLLDYINAGSNIKLDYVLQDYFNACSPNNPACIDGVTCAECNYNYNGHTEPFYFIESQLIVYSDEIISNADASFQIIAQNTMNKTIDIYLMNYEPIYGFQFKISFLTDEENTLSSIPILSGSGGRAEEENWTISTNDAGLVVGLSQYFGNPIPPGEGLLTQLTYSDDNLTSEFEIINISELEVSGYFGSTLSHDLGEPFNFEFTLNNDNSSIYPKQHSLNLSYPNPFNPVVNIPFQLHKQEMVSLKIFDIKGNEIFQIINNIKFNEGKYLQKWDASNHSSGVYFILFDAGSFSDTKKIILMK